MLNPKEVTTSSGIGWVLLPPAVDFYSLDAVEQWRAVAERFVNLGPMFRWKLVKDGKWSDEIQPEHRSAYAAAFLMDDTLEQCLRPLVVASSKELQSEIAKFDSEFPSDERETLRPLMKASQ
ncbi:hypothetical protein [Tabrizicola sp.]|uniref:hypothetical protein n=1 Tax=Tabrizicola sp. TaxID=2005166 RepID=UPI002FDDB214